MILHRLTQRELAEFASNLLTVLSGTELTAIDSHVRTTLIAAFGTLPADLVTQSSSAEMLKSQTSAAIAARDAIMSTLLVACRQVRDNLKAGLASKEQFELCGFDFADTGRTVYIAQIPSDLAVEGFSNGANKGRFKGNNTASAVMYEVWRREGDEGDWMLRAAVKAPRFVDQGIIPGQYYEYKVRARASSNVSLFSNSAVVYGVGALKPAG